MTVITSGKAGERNRKNKGDFSLPVKMYFFYKREGERARSDLKQCF